MKMLYDHQAEYLKIDRFFVDEISKSTKKRLFVSSIVNLAHVLGLKVVAEGIETEQDYMECKAIGCDLIQGYFVARPMIDHNYLQSHYDHVSKLIQKVRRMRAGNKLRLTEWTCDIEPIDVKADINSVLDRFRWQKNARSLPVVDQYGMPKGILKEDDFKEYLYGQFGWDLLQNKSLAKSVKGFLHRCPVTDRNIPTKTLLEFFSVSDISEGVILTENGKYYGYLTSESLVRILSTFNLAEAREQNPLTGLQGNNRVNDYIASLLGYAEISAVVYFDFNQFKPFNDTFGFRQGDRAIILFADILKKRYADRDSIFLGHIGGDDFFVGFQGCRAGDILVDVKAIMADFAENIESFYPDDIRRSRKLVMEDREGQKKEFDLMTVAAAIIEVDGIVGEALDQLGRRIAKAKKKSKKSENSLFVAVH